MPHDDSNFFESLGDYWEFKGPIGRVDLIGWRKKGKEYQSQDVPNIRVGKWKLEGCTKKGAGRSKGFKSYLWVESLEFDLQAFCDLDICFTLCLSPSKLRLRSLHGYAYFDKKQPSEGIRFLLVHPTLFWTYLNEPGKIAFLILEL